jgi:xyloglucan-specific exo-beta-1,4-glucanase
MARRLALASFVSAAIALAATQAATWKQVYTGAGGGWVGNVIFSPTQKGLAYLRTDIGGAYKLNSDGVSWAPLLDWVGDDHKNYWGV